ncbi:MAG: MarR family transcriptional regulator [Candidatus Eremiobacteraeota bacterium]|nr:MarR family transcriptional regulator [Candidatus Eremiobacteraeota bacterium]
MAAGAIAARFDVSRPAISQHLGVLKAAGLVWERRAGTRRLYRARAEGLLELRAFLESFWEARLRSLKHEAEASERSKIHGSHRHKGGRARNKDQRES